MKILQRREHKTSVSFNHFFERKDERGAGFMFSCDESGKPLLMNPDAERNYQECLSGANGLIDHGVSCHEHSYVEPAVGECNDCGESVCLSGFTNTCECGADYNMSGQQLASRSQWGEETGESVSDILSVDSGRDSGWDY